MQHFISKSFFYLSFLLFCFSSLVSHNIKSQNKIKTIELLAPPDGAILKTNITTLIWTGSNNDGYEVWMDGICTGKVAGDRSRLVSFPLSLGQHEWQIVAIQGSQKILSPVSHFTIENKPVSKVPEGSILLQNGWFMKSSANVDLNCRKISSERINTGEWYPTSIPVTVLSALVRNGIYPNPYTGKNNLLIPDLSDSFNNKNDLLKYSHIPGKNPWKKPYYFRRSFQINKSLYNEHIWLYINEINYKADIWLNGKLLGDTSIVKGMERSFRFEITDHIRMDSSNILLLAIYPPDHPGEPSPPPLEITDHPGRNMGADSKISLDYTKWDALGWDWQPAIRDRDMGIIEDIFITATGAVEIQDLYITSDLYLSEPKYANLLISLSLLNHLNKKHQGILKGKILAIGYKDIPIYFEYPVTLNPCETRKLTLGPDQIKQLQLQSPRLWWPVDWGKPDRYQISLSFQDKNAISHTIKETFGIRKVETYIGNNERVYKINGKDIYIKAGNWVLDMMLNWTASRYIQEVALAAGAHINLLRVWGPTGIPPETFFRAADSLGVMIWQDFLNDFWGTFKNDPKFKPRAKLFKACTIDIVKRLRNHPSLVIWCAGNEGPNQYEEMIMNEILPEYDSRGGRHYLKNSLGDGLHGSGPYHTIRPLEYFIHDNVTGFNSELGPSGVPEESSMYEFLPELGKTWYKDKFPLYGDWAYHDANERGKWDNRKFSFYDNIVRNDYGSPASFDKTGVTDYIMKCQLVNYDVYRAAIEAINQDLWKSSSGFAIWKINAGWPSLTWQLFDWYLQTNAGYYAVQKACEPLHVQLNRDSLTVSVINSSLKKYMDLNLAAEVLDFSMNLTWQKKVRMNIHKNRAWESDWPVKITGEEPVFVRLFLKQDGKKLSENIYWLHSDNNFTGLFDLTKVTLQVKTSIKRKGYKKLIHIRIKNPAPTIAFMTRFRILDSSSHEEIKSAFYSQNYISLFPYEMTELTVELDPELLSEDLLLYWHGVNVNPDQVQLIIKDK